MGNTSEYCFNTKNAYSDRLFSKMNFAIGMGSVMNVAGNYFQFNSSPNGFEADENALRSDLEAMAADFDSARRQSVETE